MIKIFINKYLIEKSLKNLIHINFLYNIVIQKY